MEQGIQVTPITEAEMSTLRNLFARFADTIVSASQLQNEVNNLRDNVRTLNDEVITVTNRNRELDEQVGEVRRQRDQALAELEQYRSQSNDIEGRIANRERTIDELRRDLEQTQGELVNRTRERDDAYYTNISLDDKLKAAKEWIEGVSRLINNPPSL